MYDNTTEVKYVPTQAGRRMDRQKYVHTFRQTLFVISPLDIPSMRVKSEQDKDSLFVVLLLVHLLHPHGRVESAQHTGNPAFVIWDDGERYVIDYDIQGLWSVIDKVRQSTLVSWLRFVVAPQGLGYIINMNWDNRMHY